jgi:predicted glutamine amidotransferase
MCIIILKPAHAELDTRLLHAAKRANPHGMGLMFSLPDGTVSVHKGLFDIETILELYETFKNETIALHFRWSTGGKIDTNNAHPFQVLSKENDGRDLWMMHNGVLSHVDDSSDYCDTYHFVKEYMTPVLRLQPELIDNPEFIEFLGESIGFYNKLLFMGGDGKVIIVNEHSGEKKDNGVWASSRFFLDRYEDDETDFNEDEILEDVEYITDMEPGLREQYIRELADAIDRADYDRIDDIVEALGNEGEEICEILEAISPEERQEIKEKKWSSGPAQEIA